MTVNGANSCQSLWPRKMLRMALILYLAILSIDTLRKIMSLSVSLVGLTHRYRRPNVCRPVSWNQEQGTRYASLPSALLNSPESLVLGWRNSSRNFGSRCLGANAPLCQQCPRMSSLFE